VHERERRAVRAAAPADAVVHYIARSSELRQSWPDGQPAAVLAELTDASGAPSAEALTAFHERAPAVPVCLYIPLQTEAVRAVVPLTARGVVSDVIVAGDGDLRVRLHSLLHHARARSEIAALRRVWHRWTPAEARPIVEACMAASERFVPVTDVARALNRSERTLERQLVHAGLPPAHRVLGWCRLLRAAYRLDQQGATVKVVAAELGYPSAHAFAQHLHRHAGLTITDLRRSGGFRGLAACARSELVTTHAHSLLRGGRGRGGRGRR
jgi:AraC-like DNA-binding protein